MNVTALYHDYNDKSGEQSFHINSFVAAGLLHVIGQYFSKWSNYFVLTLCCRNDHTCNFYNDMFHKIFAGWNEWPIQIVIVHKNKYSYVAGARRYNMIFTDSYKALEETEIHTYTANYNTNEYYYIFLQARDHLLADEMQNIFEYCWQHYLINCIIQIQNAKGQMLFYTYYPFTASHCGRVEAVLINEFNGTALVRQELFPKKLTNLYGCPLKAALWHVPPYVYLTTDSKKRTHISGGFEGKLLLELADKLNFTLDIKIPENDTQRGVILQNGSLTGALKMLTERQADISMGAFRPNILRSTVATSTINYYQTKFSVVAIADTYLLSSLKSLLYPFSTHMWYLLVIVCCLALSTTVFVKHFCRKKPARNTQHGCLDVFLMILGMPAIYISNNNVSRILSASWMMYTLVIRVIYQALLFHLIRTNITDDVPQTLEDLIQQHYSILVNRQGLEALNEISLFRYLKLIGLNSSSDELALQNLVNLSRSSSNNVVAAVPLNVLQHYAKYFQKAGIYKVLPPHIINFKVCMYLTKHSFLIDQVDSVLVWIQGFGLMEAWSRLELDENYYKSQHLQEDRTFGLQQLQMAFFAVLIGHIMATLVFVGEILCKKYNFKK